MLTLQEDGTYLLYWPIPSDTKIHAVDGSNVGAWASHSSHYYMTVY